MLTPHQGPARTGESSDTPDLKEAAAGGRRYVPPGRPSGPPQMDFPPVRNGIDYLASVVEHLDENASAVGPRDLKYAVLHLQAAVEVLLKARLLREHWSLAFKDPGTATRAAFEKGDFESCGTSAAVRRLQDVVGIAIDKKESDALDALSKDRNALQHYGLTHNAHAVEARAGRVLDFLMRFLQEELLPLLEGPERERATQDMAPVVEGVRNISSYVKRRLDRLRGELSRSQVVMCPACEQRALVVVPAGGRCRFCDQAWHDASLVFDYLGTPDARNAVTRVCLHCHVLSLVEGVVFADSPEVPDTLYCFCCGARHASHELVLCAGCTRQWFLEAEDEGTAPHLCPDCREQMEPEDAAGP
ncbi:hypothetical protein GCM10010306_014470 [Streptomyces umbrinus]|uniref:hypothetical protein n=1 Tax=Streptomyces umbrinus TaxID=67370 RepID=UPI00167BE1A2|nr:hypothetical protein [Streptomyces umbrinus]GHB22808.1 hypothetical protein GCM10010306_014470 [Streptomyces umbrinus]